MSDKTKNVRMFKRKDISLLCENLAMLLHAGIPLFIAFESIVEELDGTSYEKEIHQVNDIVKETGSLSKAMKDVGCFPEYTVQMVEVGEESGRLEDVLNALSTYYSRMDSLQKRIRNTVLYPLILLVMMTAAIIILITAVLPIFSSVLSQFDAELTASATTALNWAMLISYIALGLIVFVTLCLLVTALITRTTNGQKALSGFLSSFFLTKNIYTKLSISQFVSVMATLLRSGISPERALDMSIEIATEKKLLAKLDHSKQLVQEGAAWGDALVESGIFSPLGNRLIMIGITTGTLDDSMDDIANNYDEEVNDEFDAVISYIEPLLIALLTIIIGVVMLAAMLPLIQIIPSIG